MVSSAVPTTGEIALFAQLANRLWLQVNSPGVETVRIRHVAFLRLVQCLLTYLAAFSKTAENIHFAIEGGASVPVLRARLRKLDGSYVDSDVNLAERIKNVDGRFVYGKSTPYLPWQGGDELS